MFEWRERRELGTEVRVVGNTVSGIRLKTQRGFAVILEHR